MIFFKRTTHQKGLLNNYFNRSQVNITNVINHNKSDQEEFRKYMMEQNYEGALGILRDFHRTAENTHPLSNYYRWKIQQSRGEFYFQHEPLNDEAEELYPLSYQGEFQIDEDIIKQHKNLDNLLKYSYVKQEEIKINMKFINTWLGDRIVNPPNFDKVVSNTEWAIAIPKKSESLKLKLDVISSTNKTILDYIEMNISEWNDSFIVLDNGDQANQLLLVSIKFFFKDNQLDNTRCMFNISVMKEHANKVEANYIFSKLNKLMLVKDSYLKFKNLVDNEDFLTAKDLNVDSTLSDVEAQFEFIEKLKKIEEFFHVTLNMVKGISNEDYTNIITLTNVINGNQTCNNFNGMNLTVSERELIEKYVEYIETKGNIPTFVLSPQRNTVINLFGVDIDIGRVRYEINNIRIEKLENVRDKLKTMEDGDTIQVKFLPGENSKIKTSYVYSER